MKKNPARKIQKVIWHIRWMLLCIIILFNMVGLICSLSLVVVLATDSISFSIYFLLGQLDGYFDCKSNCHT
ncbi:hypothetical protein [Niallia oryzisoli]|uniref:hypothetical protein n=1 Tax=Niallia oryzisoli TaxID=1737571 RepID=UPI00373556EC